TLGPVIPSPRKDPMEDIGLLLAHFDDGAPMVAEGLPGEAAATGPRPKESEGPADYDYRAGDAESMPQQRWGIVAPEGEAGERLLALLAPLRKLREEQQGAPAKIYRVPAEMGEEASSKWWSEVYQDEDDARSERPRYLLLLGDADLVSWDLHQRLASDLFVGRLAFP